MVNNALVFSECETPKATAAGAKTYQAGNARKNGKTGQDKVLSDDFKKKLESCAVSDTRGMIKPETCGQMTQDNSMATVSKIQGLSSEIVGILEGFGLLNYQTDKSTALPEGVQTLIESMQLAVENSGATPQAQIQSTQLSAQIARMLSNDQLGKLPQELQQQILTAVGKYSGSLESTNNEQTAQVPNMSIMNRLEALLLEMKAVTENAAQTAVPTMQSAGSDNLAMAAQTVSVQTAAQMTGQAQAMPEQAAAAQTTQAQPVPVQTAQAQPVPDQTAAGMTAQIQAEPAQPVVQTAPAQPLQTEEEAAAQPAGNTTDTSAPVLAGTVQSQTGITDKADVAAATEPQQTEFVKDNVIRIVDKVSTQAKEGRYEFDVELKPDFLGKVSIKLTMENGEMRMRIKTDDPTVKGMFSDQSQSMMNALKEKGIVISNVDISYQDQMMTGRENFGQPADSGSQKKEGPASSILDRFSGGDLYDSLTQVGELYLGGSSVEYLA